MTTYATLNDLHSDRQTDADRADVRAVQVVGWQECHHVNLTTALGATHGVHQVRELANPGKAGVAVTWRKDAVEALIAKGLELGHMAVEGMMGRFLAWVVLSIDGRKHLVISGHRPPLRLKALWPTFDANVDALIDRLRAQYAPDVVVVLLDANQNPPTPLITRTGLAWHGVGIDGALVSGATVTNVHPLPLGDSDHRPVVMTVTPKEKPVLQLVTRAQWGARPRGATTTSHPIGATKGITAHWEGPKMGPFAHDKCAGKVRGIEAFHRDQREWADIAYNALVCPHGYVFEGRGPGVKSAANGGTTANDDWYAVCYLGGSGDPFTDLGKKAFLDAFGWLEDKGNAGPGRNGHRDHKATACPGDVIYRWVSALKDGARSSTTTAPAPAPSPAAPGPTPRWDQVVEHLRAARMLLAAIDKDFPATPAEAIHRQLASPYNAAVAESTKY